MSDNDSTVLGVIFLIRHGDRAGFYQNPTNYNPSNTVITPLGLREEQITGDYLRSVYLDSSSPSVIQGINSSFADPNQLSVLADAAGEGGVIMNSATALLQGLYPPNPDYTTTLANGTTIQAPLGGYQYVEIDSALFKNDVSLEGWTSCAPFNTATANFYNSSEFNQTAQDNAAFFATLPQYLDGRSPVNLENMWNIFDFMNVNYIHNATFRNRLPATLLAQARNLAAFHEYGVFTSPELDGIGNIGLRTMLPGIFDGISRIANSSDPLKIYYNAIAYKAFFTLFNMTSADIPAPQLTGLVNYAASAVIEVRQPAPSSGNSGSEPVLRLKFKNGTQDDALTTFNWFNTTGDVPVSTFVNFLAPTAVNTTAQWCQVCQNTQDRGCDEITGGGAASQLTVVARSLPDVDRVPQLISPARAGFMGAGVSLFAALCMLGMLSFVGLVHFGKGKSRKNRM